MVTVGVDAHKHSHTLVAVDEVGRKLSEKIVEATTDGHLDALEWAERWPERRFALEDCRHVTRRLEADLLRAGEAVVRVPPQLMAGERRGGRERGKSDPIDALAVARAALREPNLPVAQLDGPARQVRLLVDHREDLVRERTRIQARLRWHVHELFPELVIPPKALRRQHVLADLERRLGEVVGTVAAIAAELVVRTRELTLRVNELEREITALVRPMVPTLLAMPGCGALSAAKIVGEVAGVSRSVTGPPSPAGTALRRSRCGRGTRTCSASIAAATAKPTPPCTASPSPSGVASVGTAAPTWSGAWPAARPRPRPSGRCAGGSPMRSSVVSLWTTRRLTTSPPGRPTRWLLDIGASGRRGERAVPVHRGGEGREPQRRPGV